MGLKNYASAKEGGALSNKYLPFFSGRLSAKAPGLHVLPRYLTSALISLLIIGHGQLKAQCGIFLNPFPYSFNAADSTFNLHYVECDPCIYGYTGVNACRCHKNCYDEYKACMQDCRSGSGGRPPFAECMEACEMARNSCLSTCDSLPPRRKNAVGYGYYLAIAWTEGPIADPNVPAQIKLVLYHEPTPPPETLSIKLPNTTFMNKAYCFLFYIVIDYDDGSCCFFYTLECFDIG